VGDGVTAARVLVTGSTGIVGTALVARLNASGFQVTELARHSKDIAVDLAAESARMALRPWRWDVVINLAGPVPGRRGVTEGAWETIAMHANIALNLCSAVPVGWTGRLIHASSMVVYGIPDRVPVDETHRRRPMDAYAIAKCVAEDVITSAQEEKDLDVWILRLPGMFSEARHSGALYNFVSNAARGVPLTIEAAHSTPWEALHLDDAVEGIVRVMESPARAAGPMNLGYGENMGLMQMAEKIVARFKSCSPIENLTGFAHPAFCMGIEKARSLINWPPTTFERRLDHFCDVLSGAVAS
jgi:UDP-glucose 4-epimerase